MRYANVQGYINHSSIVDLFKIAVAIENNTTPKLGPLSCFIVMGLYPRPMKPECVWKSNIWDLQSMKKEHASVKIIF